MTESTEARIIRHGAFGRPSPLGSLVASAQRLTSKTMTRQGSSAKSWQEDAWEMYDLVGEQRFLAHTLASRLSQAKLYIGERSEDSTERPMPTEDADVISILDAVGGSANSRAQLLQRLGINLFVAGDGWLVGIPPRLLPVEEGIAGVSLSKPGEEATIAIEDLEWRMMSVSEVVTNAASQVTLYLGESEKERVTCSPDDLFLIRVWRPHPRKWWEADSPTRSSLPVLRELVGLTMHISAQVDSRLAGAGLLIVPQSAQRALQVAAGIDENDDVDQFTEALMEAMIKPISDRSSASALVPLVVTVPDEVTDKFNFITFAKPLDSEARSLRDEAIRRLALGQDAPPELLLGTAGMNHWGAWLVQEDVVTTHLEPPLALICDALTTQYLWPVLTEQGMDEEEAHKFVVWYDVSDLVVRPNHSQDALALHERGAISDEAVRGATGFDESDAPDTQGLPQEVVLALEMVKQSPALLAAPGLPAVVEQMRSALYGTPAPPLPGNPPAMEDPAPPKEPAPSVNESPPPPPRPVTEPGTQGEPARLPKIAASAEAVDAWWNAEEEREAAELALPFGGKGSGRYPKGSGKKEGGGDDGGGGGEEAKPSTRAKGVGTRENVDWNDRVSPAQLSAARALAREKFEALPVPTDADRAIAEARHARNKRAGGDDRGNSYQRARNRQIMLDQFGDGKTACCVNCGVKLNDDTVSLDRIITGSNNGRYVRKNLIPLDYACNNWRGDKPFEEMSALWPT
jgi:hypothetical protein